MHSELPIEPLEQHRPPSNVGMPDNSAYHCILDHLNTGATILGNQVDASTCLAALSAGPCVVGCNECITFNRFPIKGNVRIPYNRILVQCDDGIP